MHHTNHDKETGIYIRKVLEYIHTNLSDNLSLSKLSEIANYSPFHFHRIFTGFVGETPGQYIIRLRLERIAHCLNVFPALSLTELSDNSGFASLSTFSRAFKNYYGISAEEYRKTTNRVFSKISKTNSNKCKIPFNNSSEFCSWNFSETEIMEWKDKVDISTKALAGIPVSYVSTCLDHPDAITHAFRELTNWAIPRMLITAETRFIGMLLDIPFITPLNKCRYRAGISLQSKTGLLKSAGITEIPQGIYASYRVKGNMMAIVKSLIFFKHGWLDKSGYQLSDITGFELFDVNPADKPSEQIEREILIPVTPS